MTTENIEEKEFVLNKEELINYHNRLIEHPNVKLLEKCIDGQRILEEAAQIRKLVEGVPLNIEESGVDTDGEQRTKNL